MAMRLYLVQHGEARSELEDPERSLTARGEEENQEDFRRHEKAEYSSFKDLSQREEKSRADRRDHRGRLGSACPDGPKAQPERQYPAVGRTDVG